MGRQAEETVVGIFEIVIKALVCPLLLLIDIKK